MSNENNCNNFHIIKIKSIVWLVTDDFLCSRLTFPYTLLLNDKHVKQIKETYTCLDANYFVLA